VKRACSSAGCMFQQPEPKERRGTTQTLAKTHQLTRTTALPQQAAAAHEHHQSMEKQGSGCGMCHRKKSIEWCESVTAGSARAHVSAATRMRTGAHPSATTHLAVTQHPAAQPATCPQQEANGCRAPGHYGNSLCDSGHTHTPQITLLLGRGPTGSAILLTHVCVSASRTQVSHILAQHSESLKPNCQCCLLRLPLAVEQPSTPLTLKE
jgi:hypothetical protein